MEDNIFNKAKELKEKYNSLYTYRNKLNHAKGSSLSSVKLKFTVGPYIQKWTDAGGIPVKHEDESEVSSAAQDTINRLEKIYSPFLTK